MQKLKTETKRGTKIIMKLDEGEKEMKITAKGIFEDRTFHKMDYKGQEVLNAGIKKINGKKERLLTPINKKMKKWIEKAEKEIEKLKEKERQEKVVFEVIKTKNSGWAPNWKVLDRKEKLLSEEQREKIRQLRSILGEKQLFAGATKHIDVDNLPVEEGEKYTLAEIIALCEEHSEKWQQSKQEEKEHEEHYQECLKEARETGKNIKLDSYTAHCNDPNEECNTDIITIYVTPSGRKKEERTHTY